MSVFLSATTHSLEAGKYDICNVDVEEDITSELKNTLCKNDVQFKETLVYCQNFNRMSGAKKINEIHNNVSACTYDIIIGTETSWTESIKSEEVFGNNFNVFRGDRDLSLSDKKSGGGVLVAVNVMIDADLIETKKCKEFDDVWVKALINNETHIFVSVYFPPGFARKQSYEIFLNTAEKLINDMDPETKIHIYGDFNQNSVDFMEDDENESILLPIIGENETLQLIFDRTSQLGLNQINKVRNQHNTFLDLLFTNCTEDFNVNQALYPLWKNERFHTAIEYSLFFNAASTRPKECCYETVRDFKNSDLEGIQNELNKINWQAILRNSGNLDNNVTLFNKKIDEIFDEFVPKTLKKIANNCKSPAWFTTEIKKLKNKKQKLHKAYKKNGTAENLDRYINVCKILDSEITEAYENYNSKVENDVKNDPKNFFRFANEKMKTNTFPSCMKYGEFVSCDSQEICNQFAKFFQNNYKIPDDTYDSDYFDYLTEQTSIVSVDSITVPEILTTLEGLDGAKGSGPDGIPPLLLKKLSTSFVKPLFWLFNQSLASGEFPSQWKKSYLVPIFKSGKRSDIENYRGIALISCIPKLFESIINKKVFEQIKHTIASIQHGFFKGRSTTTNLLNFVNFSLAAMDRGNYVETLYTDFSKAFDRVNISLLLFKLERLGFSGKLLMWIESYLKGRTQVVRFKGKISAPVEVTSGVPQGSHLGPLLFILFVNDVTFVLKKLKVLIYADDMKLYMEMNDETDPVDFQKEVDKFYNWCLKNLLDLNVKKCNIISFSRKFTHPNISCKLGNQTVVRCTKIRDLGVVLDSKLSFVDHYNCIIHKAQNMLRFIKRFSFHFKDPYTIKTLYVAYVRSILEYCSLVWSPYHETHSNRIESVQKQFLLYALRKLGWTSYPLPSYESRCLLINIETLKKRREIASVNFVNDIISQRIKSENLLANLNFYAPTRILRTRNVFQLNSYRTSYAENGPLNSLMKIYNKYCENIDMTMSKAMIRKILNRRHLF